MCELDLKYTAAAECLSKGIPFALCVLPGKTVDSPELFVGQSNNGGVQSLDPDNFDGFEGFLFNSFGLQDSFSAFGISNGNIPAGCGDNTLESPYHYVATAKNDYMRQVRTIVNSLDSDSEKTVLSRIETIESDAEPIAAARRYFTEHANCFRYILYSPESGLWFGASPELIADHSASKSTLATMSLAGTRRLPESYNCGWDRKNTLEHNIVTDFICRTLSGFGMNVEPPSTATAVFKNIEHLCHMIYATGKIRLSALLPMMTPTPAICGWPRENALRQIVDLELHERNLYGGIVGVKHGDHTRIFLNLRCAYVENPESTIKKYVLFGGGGITRYSDPETEWEETKLKMDSLVKSIKG